MDLLGIEGRELTLRVEENKEVGDEHIVRTSEGKIGFLRGRKSLLQRLKPGDLVKGRVVREFPNYFIFVVSEVVYEAPCDIYLPVVGMLEEDGKGELVLRMKRCPALMPLTGSEVRGVIYLNGGSNE